VVDPWPSDWIEWGGVEIFVIGFTAGGAPYGLTREEYEADYEDAADDASPRPFGEDCF
jgi:hypothetical protein